MCGLASTAAAAAVAAGICGGGASAAQTIQFRSATLSTMWFRQTDCGLVKEEKQTMRLVIEYIFQGGGVIVVDKANCTGQLDNKL